jgi:hypothetical protein
MIRKFVPLLLAAAFALSACQPKSGPAAIPDGPPMEGCQVVDSIPQPDPTIQALIPAVDENDHVLGKNEAKVTFIEYSDYQ